MNRELFMLRLLHAFDHYLFFDALIPEIMDCLSKSGKEESFLNLLVKRLYQLSALGFRACDLLEEFENLGGGLYSMHLAQKEYNIRILYAFLQNGQPVLLLSFYERAGKKRTDYTPYLPPALDRFKRMKEVYERGQ